MEARRKKKETEAAAQEEEKKEAEKTAEGEEPAAAPTIMPKTEMIVLLQDFPKTPAELQALQSQGFNKLNATFVIEEVFSREMFESDEED